MTYLLLQTFLLLLSSYFFGAFVACLARRAMGLSDAKLAGVPFDVAPESYRPAEVVPLVKPRPFDPVQPKIDILPRPARRAVPAATAVLLDISRFERALTGPDPNEGMPRVMVVEICPAVLEPVTGPPQPFVPPSIIDDGDGYAHPADEEPSDERTSADIVAQDLEVEDSEGDGDVTEEEAVASSLPSSSGVAMASAAAAAAMSASHMSSYAAYREETQRSETFEATSAQPLAEDEEEAGAAEEPVETEASDADVHETDALAGTTLSGGASARIAEGAIEEPSADVVLDGDDLQSIRAIDEETEQVLKINGITTFAQIAHWTPDDIEEVDTVLELDGRIDDEQWVEQAQILARGGDTYYSRARAAQKEQDPLALAPGSGSDESSVGSGATVGASTIGGAATAIAHGTEVHGDDAYDDNDDDGDALVAQGAVDERDLEEDEEHDAEADEDRFAEDAEHILEEIEEQSVSLGALETVDTSVTASVADDEAAELVQGETFDTPEAGAVAAQGSADDGAPSTPAPQGRSVSEMAAAAAAAIAAASASVTRGIRPIEPLSPLSRANPNIVMPTKLTDAIRKRDAQASAPTPVATSVPSVGKARAEAVGQTGGKPDDLKRIRGIGVLIERQLNANGVTRYQQIANWSSSDIAVISAKLDFKGRIERENWVEQARILSSGGDTEFSKRVDRGEVDTSN